ncbi:MAG: hypothetical protein GQ578_05880 [Desulfuromonadaceae bacterium]|nr:hypothetical protein [Desulfuromonadaceae bacterium]
MLTINAALAGDKVVLRGLRELQRDMPKALQRTLTRAAIGTHREAFDFLGGAKEPSGAYPVPIVTGHLRRLLNWLKPGASKGEFRAGPLESIVYNSAEYSETIHEGHGSSTKYGARPYITDGFERFNRGNRLAKIAGEEIEAEARKKGFK